MTATPAELESRLAALEARIGPVPQANPPIVVGELADVPAPGSPIASAWSQEVSNRIAHRFANKAALDTWAAANGSIGVTLDNGWMWRRLGGIWRPFAGTPVNTSVNQIPDIAATTLGIKEAGIVAGGTTFAYPVLVSVVVAWSIGANVGQVNFTSDVVPLFNGVAVPGIANPTISTAQAYASGGQAHSWLVAAGQDAGFKLRVNILAMAAGTCHTLGTVTGLWLAT